MGKPPLAPERPTESPRTRISRRGTKFSHESVLVVVNRSGGPIYRSIPVGFQSRDVVYQVAQHLSTISAYRSLTLEIGSSNRFFGS
jgi:hypothetical protein